MIVRPSPSGDASLSASRDNSRHRRRRGQQGRHAHQATKESPPISSFSLCVLCVPCGGELPSIMCPPKTKSPHNERREHPEGCHTQSGWQPLQLTLGHERETAKRCTKNEAEQLGRLVRQRQHRKQHGARDGAGGENATNRERLITGFRRGADVCHAEEPANTDAGIDRGGNDRAWQEANDPVEDVERRERKAGDFPSEKRNGGEDGAQRKTNERPVDEADDGETRVTRWRAAR